MAGGTVIGRLILTVATHTTPHCVIHNLLDYRHVPNLAVARLTRYIRPNMGSMPEHDVSRLVELINPLPREFTLFRGELPQYRHTRTSGSNLLVAQHAFADRRQARARPRIHQAVAVDALQPDPHVFVVRELYGLLLGNGRQAQKYPSDNPNHQPNSLVGSLPNL